MGDHPGQPGWIQRRPKGLPGLRTCPPHRPLHFQAQEFDSSFTASLHPRSLLNRPSDFSVIEMYIPTSRNLDMH